MSAFILLVSILVCIAQCACIADSGRASAEINHRLPRGPFHPKDAAKLQAELLTANALESLKHGRPYKIQEIEDYSGTGFLIQDIHAPPSIVWATLLDFDEYPNRIPKLSACQTYEVAKTAHRTVWLTEMTVSYRLPSLKFFIAIGYRLVSLNFFVKHEYHPKDNVMVWTLDETSGRESDLASSFGYWYVEAHPTNEGWSRVTYHVHVSLLDGIPSFAWKYMTKQALIEATTWIKTFSEASYKKERQRLKHPEAIGNPKSPNHSSDSMGDIENAKPGANVTLPNPTSSPPSIGYSRYFLVSSVMGLLFFNTYLYFSHYL